MKWNNVNTGKSIYHQIELQNPQQNSEYSHQAQDGKVYYAISSVSAISMSRNVPRPPVFSLNLDAVAIPHHMGN